MELLKTRTLYRASLLLNSKARLLCTFSKTSKERRCYSACITQKPRNSWSRLSVSVGHPILFPNSNYHDSLLHTNDGGLRAPSSSFSTSPKTFQQGPTDLIFPEFPTIQAAEHVLLMIHNSTGLPWWSAIIASAFLLRTVLPLPLSVYSMYNSVRLQRLQPEIKEIAQQLKKEVSMAMHKFKWNEKKAKTEYIKNMKRHLRNLYIRDNCHPMKDTASFWVRIPLWVSASYALRNMSVRAKNPLLDNHEDCQSLSSEGIAWFADLTVVDSTWILPVMMGAVTLLNIEIGRRSVAQVTSYRKGLTFALRGLALVFIPISSYLPSGLVLYWVASGFFSALQTVLVDRSTAFRSLIGIKQGSVMRDEKESSPPKY